jgi:hypothetical protein
MPKNLDHVRSLARQDSLAVAATARPDGTVHASLVNAGVIEDPVVGLPCIGFVAHGSSRKLAHMRNSGRATVVFRNGADWVAVEGPVRLLGPDDPIEGLGAGQLAMLLRGVFVAAGGTHQDWDEFDRVMQADRRTAVLIMPERISANG